MTVDAGTDPVSGRERRVTRSVPATPGQQRPPKAARELEARLLLEVGTGEHRDARVNATQIEQWTGNPTRVVTVAQKDLRRMRRARERILTEWERDLVVVQGSRDALKAAD